MCGITGWIDWEQDLSQQQAVLEQMACTLKERGPDSEGYWLSPHAALAHRRLIVIDPVGGKQPMLFTQGEQTYALTYNGELYNFRELREELRTRDHVFRTHSDTEVLLHAYVEWGEECVNHFNGIFAFAIWDEARQRLFIARDHLGVKPLFYAQVGSAVVFGSEIKALLAHPLVEPVLDDEGMKAIFVSLFMSGGGIFRDIHELRPAHCATFTRERTHIRPYWQLVSRPHTDDLETTAEYIRSLLKDTVKRQLIADVPVVTLLSGGLDSSGVTSLAAREFQSEHKVLDTYAINYANSEEHFEGNAIRPSIDRPYVEQVARYLPTNHHDVVVSTDELIENLLVPMRAHDRPKMGQIETSLYLLFKVIKQNATVALSGESADEVFGGYPWFHQEHVLNTPTFPWIAARMNPRGDNQFMNMGTPFLSPALAQELQPREHMQRLYQEALAEVPRLEGESPRDARIREIFYLNMTRFLLLLLDRKDRMSMATGLEVRVPFCDHRLVQYVWNIPWEMKTVDNIEKGILRRAFSGLLPEEVRMRRKSAYPTSFDPAYTQAVRRWTLEILNNANAPVNAFVNGAFIRQLAEHPDEEMRGENAYFLFDYLIQANAWLQEYHVITP
ncbi:asparagine synthase (glutamine-hydrolyzing) [Ktedonobacter racemifer]|uniref:asparagine synthase (glutamine-hydrolyzing) n=1 Tax=Ktedonobacter racemifer DSM 44963 TaxID=485913 RepID=D6TVA4_KTERA|nr:asparagine synthase (glutamine-hydrolyzing) [Ktedonobacter racemifer]EFH84204.1 asparagine synthase (glutamine-hydrolyzing) [Ktedonobacter racemifer DSM 44963]